MSKYRLGVKHSLVAIYEAVASKLLWQAVLFTFTVMAQSSDGDNVTAPSCPKGVSQTLNGSQLGCGDSSCIGVQSVSCCCFVSKSCFQEFFLECFSLGIRKMKAYIINSEKKAVWLRKAKTR